MYSTLSFAVAVVATAALTVSPECLAQEPGPGPSTFGSYRRNEPSPLVFNFMHLDGLDDQYSADFRSGNCKPEFNIVFGGVAVASGEIEFEGQISEHSPVCKLSVKVDKTQGTVEITEKNKQSCLMYHPGICNFSGSYKKIK
jgi:hypothetical protein